MIKQVTLIALLWGVKALEALAEEEAMAEEQALV